MVSIEFQAPKIKAALGHAVANHRLALGLSQEELSSKCGIAANSISRTECGKGNLTYFNLKRLAAGLGLPASRLLAYAEDMEKAEKSTEAKLSASASNEPARALAAGHRKSAKAPPKRAKAPRKTVRERRQERKNVSADAARAMAVSELGPAPSTGPPRAGGDSAAPRTGVT